MGQCEMGCVYVSKSLSIKVRNFKMLKSFLFRNCCFIKINICMPVEEFIEYKKHINMQNVSPLVAFLGANDKCCL